MISMQEKRDWFEQLLQPTVAEEFNEQAWLSRRRSLARNQVRELPLPTRKSESWRYSRLEDLLGQTFAPSNDAFQALQPDDIDDWLLEDTRSYRVVLANGRYVPSLQSFTGLPAGVTISSMRQVLRQQPGMLSTWFSQTANHSQDVFTALNTALMNDGLFVHLARDTQLDRPLEVMHLNLSLEQTALVQPCNLLVLEQGAQAEIIEHYTSTGASSYFHNGVSEILLEENARLTHLQLQEESPQAYHLHRRFISQAANSAYQSISVALGGKWARQEMQVRFQAENAQCQSRGLYLVGKQQFSEQHLDVLHNTPANRSMHLYKGILYGAGRAVFDGRIRVGHAAQKTDAHLNNHNLLLDRAADIVTKPQLEIYADDVQCSHGTTVGQLEAEPLYYLRSRGINQANAIKMLCSGFAAEIFADMTNLTLAEQLQEKLELLLAAVLDQAREVQHD